MKQIITWVGHGSWKMRTPSGTVIYVDPWIVGNPACKMKIEDTDDADIVVVTHGHDDHIGNAIEICKRTNAILVTLPDVYVYASHYGIPMDDRGGAVHLGGSVREKDCVFHAVQALHTSDIWGYEYLDHNELIPGSGCCGMVVDVDDGKPVYFAGDTGVFSDMQLISELYHPFVSVLPIGDKYVMGIREAAYAAKFINSPYIIPGHYNTFPAIQADTKKFVQLVKEQATKSEVIILEPSEDFEF